MNSLEKWFAARN